MPNCDGCEKCAGYCANCNRRAEIAQPPYRKEGCEYCDFSRFDVGARMNTSGDRFVMIKSEDGVNLASDDKYFRLLKINYCPMCGRKLKSDN